MKWCFMGKAAQTGDCFTARFARLRRLVVSPCRKPQLPPLRRLYLHRNKFSGVIPANLSGCSYLEELVLGINKLGGSIPKEMSLLSKLYLLGDPMVGAFQMPLGLWKSLTGFGCGLCNLYGSIPRSIFNLSLLVNFSLLGNHLTGNLSDQLSYLYLTDNELFGSLPSSIGPIPNAIGNLSLLTQLYLYSNELEGHIPSSLGNCKELNFLDLVDNRLSGKIPKQILQLRSLTIGLDLSQNSLSGSVPSEIKDLNMLSYLDLSHNNLSGNITRVLGIGGSDDDKSGESKFWKLLIELMNGRKAS
ncbi:kinase-like domain-containing protein [Tanacetum coccineum]